MNRIILTGRITRDLELRATGTGNYIVSYQLAVQRDKDNTDFINIITYGEFAKTLCKYCQKGDLIGIEGKLQISTYQDKEGNNKTTYSVWTDKVEFLQSKNKKEEDPKPQTSVKQEEIVITDADLPF